VHTRPTSLSDQHRSVQDVHSRKNLQRASLPQTLIMAFSPIGFRALSALTRVQTRQSVPTHVLHLNARRLATVVDVCSLINWALSEDDNLTYITQRTPAPNFHIPLIDFGKYLSATSAEEKQATANEIAQGFKEVCL
jgi:hypothetical protein